jgi:hypothetical protein
MTRDPFLVASTVIIAAVLASSGCSLFDPADLGEHEDFQAEFELLWNAFDGQYAGFGFTDADWDLLYETYSARIDTVTSQEGFALLMHDMLSPLQDPAVLIYSPFGEVDSTFSPGILQNCDSTVLMSYLEPAGIEWFTPGVWGYSIFQDSIPYVFILNWTSGMYAQDITELLELYPDAPALIIDQRLARGGSQTQLRQVGMRFNDQMRVGFYTVGRDGPEHDDFCEPRAYVVHSLPSSFDGPVAILIGEANSGAAQRFAAMADEIPSVTLIGDTTLTGADFRSGVTALPGNWSYALPDSTVLLADSSTWLSDVGVSPDIYVEATEDDFSQGIDPVLEFAVDWAASRGK